MAKPVRPKAADMVKTLIDAGFREKEAEDKKAGVHFGYFEENYVTTRHKSFPIILPREVKNNYTPKVFKQVEELVEILKTETQGMILLHGSPGTGKTYLIRAIISSLIGIRDAVVCTPPTAFLAQPVQMSTGLSDMTNPLIIFEDLGDLMKEDVKARYADHFSNLANMTDGLLSLLNNSVYLMTFNYPIKDLDAALTRDGRCIMNIEVPRLPIKQVRSMIPTGTDLGDSKTLSLAEVYALKNKGKKVKEARPLGFNTRRNKGYDDPVDSHYVGV